MENGEPIENTHCQPHSSYNFCLVNFSLLLVLRVPPLILRMGKDMSDEDFFKFVFNFRDHPVIVSTDIEHDIGCNVMALEKVTRRSAKFFQSAFTVSLY